MERQQATRLRHLCTWVDGVGQPPYLCQQNGRTPLPILILKESNPSSLFEATKPLCTSLPLAGSTRPFRCTSSKRENSRACVGQSSSFAPGAGGSPPPPGGCWVIYVAFQFLHRVACRVGVSFRSERSPAGSLHRGGGCPARRLTGQTPGWANLLL